MKPSILLKMTSPLGEGYEIPYHDFGPKDQEPTVVLVGGIHGNELNSIFVLARLAAQLDSFAKRNQTDQAFLGRIIIIPAVNILGMHTRHREWPFDKTDINRMFPGYDAGETTQRIADAVFKLTRSAKIRIDIHASNLEIEELPQVRIYDTYHPTHDSARLFGLPAIIQCPVNKTASATLLNAWMNEGGENFVVQMGMAGHIQTHHCDQVLKALLRFLGGKKLLSGESAESWTASASEPANDVHYFGLHQTVSLLSEKAGLFVVSAKLGSWIEKGDRLGTVYDGFNGQVRAHVRAPISGLLTAIRRQALLYQGDLLARIQTRTPSTSSPDTYLIGQGQ